MQTFNLMPLAYRQRLAFRADLKIFLALLTTTVILAVAVRGVIDDDIERNKLKYAKITESKKLINAQQAEMERLTQSKKRLESRYKLMQGMKGNVSVQELFLALDASLSPDILFDGLTFERAGEPVTKEQEQTVNSYFIILPKESDDKNSRFNAWRIKANMNIKGRAKDHSALAEFMKSLSAQAKIERVELLSSSTGKNAEAERINFELFVIVNNIAKHVL